MRLKPYILGIQDGIEQPYDLSSGMTWERDQGANEAYDRGANMGQLIGRAKEYILVPVSAISARLAQIRHFLP